MIKIDNTLISEHLIEKKFACDLDVCKGFCCIEGDAGAPLEEQELTILDDCFEDIKPFMRKEGIMAVEKNGKYVVDDDGEYVTPLVDRKECAYIIFNEKGSTQCAIEQAYYEKKIDFQKPISCHLYPVRISKYQHYDAVNFAHWHICQSAYECGNKQGIKVYQFVKDALIRKFGEEWFSKLKKADK